jgi:serpin B
MVMRNELSSICAVIVCAGWLAHAALGQETVEPEVAAIVAGNSDFAFDLYRTLAGGTDGNLFFSPYSISTALAMTYAGARGNTEAQMAEVLHFALPQDQLHPAFGALMGDLDGRDPTAYQLDVANRLWGQEDYVFLTEFLDTTGTHYGAELQEVDFAGGTEQARQTINAWVEEQTQGKIDELLQPNHLSVSTRLVLTNAIYFLGGWKHRFDEGLTRDRAFRLSSDEQVMVPMMQQEGDFGYTRYRETEILELPYVQDEISMMVLLPASPGGVADVAAWLSEETLAECVASLQATSLVVGLPKFRITGEFDLRNTLSSMGMSDAFSASADFSGMTGGRDLAISKVVHQAVIDVGEVGTEAAGATAVIMRESVAETFLADHPFLFLIRDNQTGSVLFAGRVADPSTLAKPIPEPGAWVLLANGGLIVLVTTSRRTSTSSRAPFTDAWGPTSGKE